MGRLERLTAAAALLLAFAAVPACSPAEPELTVAETEARQAADDAERLWDAYRAGPTSDLYRAFLDANLAAARRHGEPHDALGVRLQVRRLQAAALQASNVHDTAERGRLAFDVIDTIDSIERRDLFRVWDDVFPGASATLTAARESARTLVR